MINEFAGKIKKYMPKAVELDTFDAVKVYGKYMEDEKALAQSDMKWNIWLLIYGLYDIVVLYTELPL